MTPILEQKLFDDYPMLFDNRNKSPMESCMAFGIECGDGWYDLIRSICWEIKQHEDNIRWRREYLEKNDPEKLANEQEYFSVKFDQIKEKFGGLRIYFSGGDDRVRGMIGLAEEMSYKLCEECGNRGEPNKNGWISTLCNNCRKQ